MSTADELRRVAHRVWWSALRERFDLTRPSLPEDLVGSVQFATRTDAGEDYFHVVLDGRQSRCGEGLLPSSDTWIEIDRGELTRLLVGEAHAASAFRVVGEDSLFTRLYDALESGPKTESWLSVRNGS